METKQPCFSLREIFDLDPAVLNHMQFSFILEQKSFNRFQIEKTMIENGSNNFSFILNFRVLQKEQKEVLSLVTSNLAH